MKTTRIIIASDIHLCHKDWYGMKCGDRVAKFVSELEEEYRRAPYDALLLLGDYSLDHWAWETQGCYLKEGISNTEIFAREYMKPIRFLPIHISMIAGNHEQYGEQTWKKITGFSREDIYRVGKYAFLMLDTFAENLDPTEHSDGTYTPVDVDKVRAFLETYPKEYFVLCAHHFDPEKESEDFKKLLREEKRILCLFGGHVHRSRLVPLGEEFGNKYLIYTGNYSYTMENPITESMWGYREVILSDDGISTCYITPKSRVLTNEGEWIDHKFVLTREGVWVEHAYGTQDALEISVL